MCFQLVKKLPKRPRFWYNKGNGDVIMDQWRKDARKEPIIIDIDSFVPADHLLRKIEKVMDYEWLYEKTGKLELEQLLFLANIAHIHT